MTALSRRRTCRRSRPPRPATPLPALPRGPAGLRGRRPGATRAWRTSGAMVRVRAADVSDTGCQEQHDVPVSRTETAQAEGTRARVERAALDLFTRRGF